MPKLSESSAPGCRNTVLVTSLLVGAGLVLLAVGLTLARQATCVGACESLALAALFAGGPISAIFTVVFGELVLGWPIDITTWVVTGFLLTRWAESRGRRPLAAGVMALVVAFAYGLVLSQLVELGV